MRTSRCAPRSARRRKDLEAFDAAWVATFVTDGDAGVLDDLMRAASAVLPRTALPSPTRTPGGWRTSRCRPPTATKSCCREGLRAYTAAERVAARGRCCARLADVARAVVAAHAADARRGATRTIRARPCASAAPRRRAGRAPQGRQPDVRQRPLVLVVDVSGSMAPYARMLLQYVQAAVAARRRVEAFALGTRLTRITRELAGRDPDRALARATERVVDLGGGTRIGAALGELNRMHGRRLGRGAVVVILSDGWDRGEPEELAPEMARLRPHAHRLVWLNPLAASPTYAPLTRGMQAALPHADDFLPGNSLRRSWPSPT